MKTVTYLSITLLLLMSIIIFTSCEKKSVDEQFISSMEQGLQERWEINDSRPDGTKEDWKAYINAEYSAVEKYKDEKFEDKELGKLAKEYITALSKSLDVVDEYNPSSNYDRFWNAYLPYYSDRNLIIRTIYNGNYGFKVSEDNQENLDGLLASGWLSEMLSKIEFTGKDEYGWTTYTASVVNDSGFDLDYVSLEINLLDKSGKTVDVTYASVENWDKDSTRQLEFMSDNSQASSYELVGGDCSIQ